jgi:hypothetical protein
MGSGNKPPNQGRIAQSRAIDNSYGGGGGTSKLEPSSPPAQRGLLRSNQEAQEGGAVKRPRLHQNGQEVIVEVCYIAFPNGMATD